MVKKEANHNKNEEIGLKLGNCYTSDITKKELQVLKHFANGKSYIEISEEMNISINTVKYHVKTLLGKTGYNNTVMLVAHAVATGLIEI